MAGYGINTDVSLSCIPTLKENGFVCARMDRGVWKKGSGDKLLIAYVTFFGDGSESICIQDIRKGKMSRVVNNKDSLKFLLKEIKRNENMEKLFN